MYINNPAKQNFTIKIKKINKYQINMDQIVVQMLLKFIRENQFKKFNHNMMLKKSLTNTKVTACKLKKFTKLVIIRI